MDTNLYDFEEEPLKRPSFLTALCILTFIGSGWGILSSVWTYTTAAKSHGMFSQIKHESNDTGLGKDSIELSSSRRLDSSHRNSNAFEHKMSAAFSRIFTEENIRRTAIGGFISSLLTLLGAVLMWRLDRRGFYLYIAGVVAGILVPFYIYGNNFLAIGISSFGSFFGLIFIALYALNFKSMKQ